jgi:hypothetical protein
MTIEPINIQEDTSLRKPYTIPEIVYELELETRAGSPLGFPDALDLTGNE